MRHNVRSRRNPRTAKDPSKAKHQFPPVSPPLKERLFPGLSVGVKAKIRFWVQFCLHRLNPSVFTSFLASLLTYKACCLLSVKTSFVWGWERRAIPCMAFLRSLGRSWAQFFKQSSVPTMLGSKIRLILPFVVYFIAEQALVATQNIDQIKASSEAGCSTASPRGWWSWGGRQGSSSTMPH